MLIFYRKVVVIFLNLFFETKWDNWMCVINYYAGHVHSGKCNASVWCLSCLVYTHVDIPWDSTQHCLQMFRPLCMRTDTPAISDLYFLCLCCRLHLITSKLLMSALILWPQKSFISVISWKESTRQGPGLLKHSCLWNISRNLWKITEVFHTCSLILFKCVLQTISVC